MSKQPNTAGVMKQIFTRHLTRSMGFAESLTNDFLSPNVNAVVKGIASGNLAQKLSLPGREAKVQRKVEIPRADFQRLPVALGY